MKPRVPLEQHDRIYRLYHRGAGGLRALARSEGLPITTVRDLVNRAPELHGFDLQTAQRLRDQCVPLATARYLITTHTTHTVQQQATHLALSCQRVRDLRWRLAQLDLLDVSASHYARQHTITPAIQARVRYLVARGVEAAGIAQATGLSLHSVGHLIRHMGGVEALQQDGLTYNGVAEMFGVRVARVRWWVAQGWLLPTPHEGNRYERVSMIALRAFVCVRAAWPSYSPHLISHDDLRRTALDCQRTAGGVWRNQTELARVADCLLDTVRRRIASGWLADWESTRFGHSLYIWHPVNVPLPPYQAPQTPAQVPSEAFYESEGHQ